MLKLAPAARHRLDRSCTCNFVDIFPLGGPTLFHIHATKYPERPHKRRQLQKRERHFTASGQLQDPTPYNRSYLLRYLPSLFMLTQPSLTCCVPTTALVSQDLVETRDCNRDSVPRSGSFRYGEPPEEVSVDQSPAEKRSADSVSARLDCGVRALASVLVTGGPNKRLVGTMFACFAIMLMHCLGAFVGGIGLHTVS